MIKIHSIKLSIVLTCMIALCIGAGKIDTPKKYKWTGMWQFTRTSAGDGITALATKIGYNVQLDNVNSYLQAIANVNKQFPGSKPWTTLPVGELSHLEPVAKSLSEADQESYFKGMDKNNINVFIELFPSKKQDVNTQIEMWLAKYSHHKSVIGVGIELEYFGKATDSLAKVWDSKIKSFNPAYRMFLRHYSPTYMPPTYRGKGDLIFIDDASEGTREELNKGFAEWAKNFAPTACVFQIGYPADEDAMDGNNSNGWWKLKNPIKEWGDEILALTNNPNQELGLIWVTAKSGKSYHKKWDLTKSIKF